MMIPVITQKNGNIVEEEKDITGKKTVIFDVDGTLTESKADMTDETASLICDLMRIKKVALLGGGNYGQLRVQCADKLPCLKDENTSAGILLSPVSGGALYVHENGAWEKIYNLAFTDEERNNVMEAFRHALAEIHYKQPETVYGEVIEDREAQITFSALGQNAPVEEKQAWKDHHDIRPQLKQALERRLPGFSIRIGGSTSVDVGKVNKAYGVEQIGKIFHTDITEMLFIGDGLEEGGNDHDVLATGIDAVAVDDHKHTQLIVSRLISNLTEHAHEKE